MKERFLQQYNPSRTVDEAISKAINVSVQHNSLYIQNVDPKLKRKVRDHWEGYLSGLIPLFEIENRSVQEYYKSIEDLKIQMNENFAQNAFLAEPHIKYHTDSGFRISHAQKSISVFLKHLWCMDKIPMPPQCPVDSRILKVAGLRYPNTKWGYVNSIEEHKAKTEILKKAANGEPLAIWELNNF